jgi:hypothetical protein
MRRVLLIAGVCWMMSAVSFAEVKPASLFSDHAVLQSGMSVPVWERPIRERR